MTPASCEATHIAYRASHLYVAAPCHVEDSLAGQSAQADPLELQKQQEAERRAAARTRVKEKLRPKTPEAVDGRKHIDVQTELYLEELSDRVEEHDAEAQTDAFLDRPPSPLFVPPKTGIDAHTQILPGEVPTVCTLDCVSCGAAL